MVEFLNRTKMLLGETAVDRCTKASVAVFGLGGVGSFTAEALARSGVGKLTLIDNDVVTKSNINRQLIALQSTVGKRKTDLMRRRIADINPDAEVVCHSVFFCEETKNEIFSQSLGHFDYIVDAIDTVSSKLLLIQTAKNENIPIISSMGAANKLDPTRFRVTDIYKTAMDPLAKVMRRELKKLGIPKLKVVCSDEPPLTPVLDLGETKNNRPAPASVAWVPSVAGLILAGEVIKDLMKK
ncbi:ThiF family adenylyltransferase [Acetivibrio sp. MSJd-27]|uniref:tRNA threonylcarbamoyladenosine dehydratase n=1 Tax=Acetivibrio sp. MSJd-27 TaxID=2841523 RepID=UPI001C109DDB|nr:tRNA threonylcarbamoyladenosine dehydratase [Acetivibrio sp. MSJd-27]MBU5449539.1 tRNA threonylcarbamoyladenosine dehydratase [Acetivibrio sp. MSJd-27]